jgi:hypothetical protein
VHSPTNMHAEKQTNPMPWSTRVLLTALALFLGFFSHALGGWGLPVGVVGAAILIPVLKYQRFWHRLWFWLTIIALSILQVPLVILTRPLMDEFKLGFNLLLATVDGIFVILVVNWIRPKEDNSGRI